MRKDIVIVTASHKNEMPRDNNNIIIQAGDQKMKKSKYLSYCLVLISLCLITLLTITASYSVLAKDDYVHAVGVGVFNTSFFKYLKASINYMIHMYNNWQGTYFSMFIQALLSPVNNIGMPLLKIVMVLNVLLLYLSLAFLITSLFKNEQLLIRTSVFTLVIIQVICYTYYSEIYYWYSGAVSYSIPLAFTLTGIALLINYYRESKTSYLILSTLCGFVSGGGSLTVAGLGCYSVLVILIYSYLNKKKDKKLLIVFILWVIFALVNTLAPGNYIRHSVFDSSGLQYIDAIKYDIKTVWFRFKVLVKQSPIILYCLLFIFLGYKSTNKTNPNKLIVSIIYSLVSFVVTFPLVLAVSNYAFDCSRTNFIIDFGIIISFGLLCFNLGSYCKDFINKYIKIYKILLVLAFIGCLFIRPTNIIYLTSQLFNDSYSNYYSEYMELLDYFKESKGKDIVLKENDVPKKLEGFYNFELYSDPSDSGYNEAVANYFGINSLKVIK